MGSTTYWVALTAWRSMLRGRRDDGLKRATASLRANLAFNLRAARAKLDLSQEAAAERVGYSLQYYQRMERKIVNVPLDTIARLAWSLGVDPAALLRKR